MANLKKIFILFGSIISLSQAIELGSLKSTKTPRTTKLQPTKQPILASTSLYRLNATNGFTCILIQTDGLLTIKYHNKLGEYIEADVYLPDFPELACDCTDPDFESMSMSFKGFLLNIYFRKTPGGERWYVSGMDLTYSSSNPIFEHIDRPNLKVKLVTPVRQSMFFGTPVGKSYSCQNEQEVLMYAPPDSDDKSGHIAKLFLRDTRMQSFMYKESGAWGPTFICNPKGTYHDETAPLAVGTTLAAFTLLIIGGYAGWRYYKVKKVQYGTME